MKCLCGFSQMPNNTVILGKHMQDCMVSGPLKGLIPDPVVVWRNGEFVVVKNAEEGENIVDVPVVRPRPHVEMVEKKVQAQSAMLEAVEAAVETPEQFEEILDAVAAGAEVPFVEEVVAQEEEAVEEEKPKPAPKKRAPKKKTS